MRQAAWSGANKGYALECQACRVFCDARILNIFKGAAEIQANIIAKGLVSRAV